MTPRMRPWTATVLVAGLLIAVPAACHGQNWPQWRGPWGTGVSPERNVPIIWNEHRGVDWTCPLPGSGTSTPAIWGNGIFVTTQTDDNRLLLLRINKASGQVEWTRQVGSGEAPRETPEERSRQKFHRWHNLASPSPATNGEVVVVHFGNGDLAAYTCLDGEQLWKRNLQDDYGPYSIWWGHANSPVLFQDVVISACMQDSLGDLPQQPDAESYLVANDLRNGRVRWKTSRDTGAVSEEGDAYTTPLLTEFGGIAQLIIMGGNQLDAYDPETGDQLWYLPGLRGGRTVTGPTLAHDMVYVTRGMRGPLVAVRLGQLGELSNRQIAWRQTQGTPDSCSPVVWGDLLFTITDEGIARCFDAVSGHQRWRKRLPGAYKASPMAADGRIYFLNTEGVCTVVSASPRYDEIATNSLDDTTLASPCTSEGRLFIRGDQALYCISR